MKLLHHAAKKDWEDVDKAPAAQQSTVCWARFKEKQSSEQSLKGVHPIVFVSNIFPISCQFSIDPCNSSLVQLYHMT